MLRGLNDTRNVASHGYAQLDPALTGEIANTYLGDVLNRLERTLDGRETEAES